MPYSMKRYLLLACFGLFFMSGLFGQDVDFIVKIDTVSITSKTINLTVVVNAGQPDFSVYLMDNVPYQGGKVTSYGKKIDTRTYFFSDIKMQNFYVCVMDEKKSLSCKKNSTLVSKQQ